MDHGLLVVGGGEGDTLDVPTRWPGPGTSTVDEARQHLGLGVVAMVTGTRLELGDVLGLVGDDGGLL